MPPRCPSRAAPPAAARAAPMSRCRRSGTRGRQRLLRAQRAPSTPPTTSQPAPPALLTRLRSRTAQWTPTRTHGGCGRLLRHSRSSRGLWGRRPGPRPARGRRGSGGRRGSARAPRQGRGRRRTTWAPPCRWVHSTGEQTIRYGWRRRRPCPPSRRRGHTSPWQQPPCTSASPAWRRQVAAAPAERCARSASFQADDLTAAG
mmetsp:Transcript_92057/g.269361  ORF Transcript_92057/g.269361 Transcript_92057/m.269361 type:complete len:202 (-) Transcript_92057:162-767(-)